MSTESLAQFLTLFHACGSRTAVLRKLMQARDHKASRVPVEEILDRCKRDGRRVQNPNQIQARVEADLKWAEHESNHLLRYTDATYPTLLQHISAYPLLLYASGDVKLLQQPQVAIVGSRECTPGGAQHAFEFSAELAAAGLVVTSGLALGIDSQAHQGALTCGKTIAVTATGADQIYPRRNRRLADQIREKGLLITEFPLGTTARAEFFPRRNRIISGLALATLVVEAAYRSGSLVTARLAAEQGREVFAIPGSIRNPQSRGCHQLIRDGAGIAESAEDIVFAIGNLLNFALSQQSDTTRSSRPMLEPEQAQLLNHIGFDPVTTDIIVERSGLTVDQVSSMLLLLELKDFIQSAPGGCFVRI